MESLSNISSLSFEEEAIEALILVQLRKPHPIKPGYQILISLSPISTNLLSLTSLRSFFEVQGGGGRYAERPSPATARAVVRFLRKEGLARLQPAVARNVKAAMDFVDSEAARGIG